MKGSCEFVVLLHEGTDGPFTWFVTLLERRDCERWKKTAEGGHPTIFHAILHFAKSAEAARGVV